MKYEEMLNLNVKIEQKMVKTWGEGGSPTELMDPLQRMVNNSINCDSNELENDDQIIKYIE